jgi:hypothetical protein
MATASCRKSQGNRREYTNSVPARCMTICGSLFRTDGFRNWGHAGEMMILAGAITDSLMLDGMSSELRLPASRKLSARHARDCESQVLGGSNA